MAVRGSRVLYRSGLPSPRQVIADVIPPPLTRGCNAAPQLVRLISINRTAPGLSVCWCFRCDCFVSDILAGLCIRDLQLVRGPVCVFLRFSAQIPVFSLGAYGVGDVVIGYLHALLSTVNC